MYMATWWIVTGLVTSVAQKSRSPGCRSERGMWGPAFHWSAATRGSWMPTWEYDHWVRPLQSNVPGPVAPQTYGSPSRLRAAAIAPAAMSLGGVVPAGSAPDASSSADENACAL